MVIVIEWIEQSIIWWKTDYDYRFADNDYEHEDYEVSMLYARTFVKLNNSFP